MKISGLPIVAPVVGLFGPIESYAEECPSQTDTLESLATEFGWELEDPEEFQDDMFSKCWRELYSIRRNNRSVYIDIRVLGKQMPLREQFIYHTAKNDAFAEYDEEMRQSIMGSRLSP